MQYIKLGPVKIPYSIKKDKNKKSIRIFSLNIPYETYQKNNRKYFKIWKLTFPSPVKSKVILSQGNLNFLMREQFSDEYIEKTAIKIFEEKLGYTPNLSNPETFNEKIFWLKLHYHNPLVTVCCDKFAVKDYVNEVLGGGFVIPTLKSWENADEIDFSSLPEKYVLKVNWSSGYNIIVKDKNDLDEKWARQQITHWLKPEQNSFYQTFNWGYKDMKPVVYAEKYMEQFDGQLYDYKFYCCSGKAKFLFIATNRADKSTLTYDFFDMDFNHLDFYYGGRGHSNTPLQKPKFFDEMVKCAEKLSKPFPFVRVDFYETDEGFFVGEMTFYSGGGILTFDPEEWDYKLGEYIDLFIKAEEK